MLLYFGIIYYLLVEQSSWFVCAAEESVQNFQGTLAEIGDLPYIVSIVTEGISVCTGAIVAENWVLTAAHCLASDGDVIFPSEVKIYGGINDFTDLAVLSKQERRPSEIKIHPRYWAHRLAKFDLALVKLKEPFEFNANVSKVNVSGTEWTKDQSLQCVASGFGKFSLKKGNTRLKIINVVAKHGEDACPCTKRFQWRRLICLKPEKDASICKGDSGGPLVCGGEAVGIAHMIMDKNACSFYRDPDLECGTLRTISIYMFLCPYLDWLAEYVPDVPSAPYSCKACATAPDVLIIVLIYSCFIIYNRRNYIFKLCFITANELNDLNDN